MPNKIQTHSLEVSPSTKKTIFRRKANDKEKKLLCFSEIGATITSLRTAVHFQDLVKTSNGSSSPVENQNDLELDFKVFFFVDSCC